MNLLFEIFFICFIFCFFDKVARIVCLRAETIDDTYAMVAQYFCFWYLIREAITSFCEDNLIIFSTRFCFTDKKLKTLTDTPILIDREKYPIDGLEGFYYCHTEILILKALDSAFEKRLMIIIYYDPEFISSRLCLRKRETIDMSWMERIRVHGCDSESSHNEKIIFWIV